MGNISLQIYYGFLPLPITAYDLILAASLMFYQCFNLIGQIVLCPDQKNTCRAAKNKGTGGTRPL